MNSKSKKCVRSTQVGSTLQALKEEENSYRTQDVTNKTYFLKERSSGLHFRVTLLLLEWMKGLEIKSLYAFSFIVPRKPLRLFETRWTNTLLAPREVERKTIKASFSSDSVSLLLYCKSRDE